MISEAKKIGLDVLTVEVLIQRAEEAIENGKFEKAGKYALQSLEEIEEVKDETQQAASLIQLVKNYINEAEGLRANTKEARKLYERALAELKNNRYADSIDLSKRAIKLAKEAKKGHVAETIQMFKSIVDKAKEEGLNVTSATKKINEAQDALKKEKFSEALRLAMQSENEIEQIDLQKKLATDTLSTTLANIKQAEEEGIDVKRASTLLKKATSALKDEDYMIALHWAIESGNEVAYAYEHFEKSSAMLHAAQARIKEGETIGADVGKAKDILKSAQTTVEEKDYESCIAYAKEAIKEAKKAYEKQLGQPIEICETLMKTGAGMGVDVSRAENIIKEAKVALEEEAYTQVRLYTENSRRLVEKEIRKRLYEILSETKGTEKDDKASGKDYSEGIALLKKGISALDGKDYSTASELISKGWKILSGGAVEELVEPESGKPLEKKPEIEEEQKISAAKFSRIKAEKQSKCVVCKGKIKAGLPIIRCRCGFSYHETCGDRVAKCIKCGQKFVGTKVAKKKVALKLG